MVRTQIIINKSNYIERLDRYVYKLGQGVNLSGAKMSLLSCSVYNSVYNIKTVYKNNRIGVKWIDNVIYEFIIPDGVYSIADINDFLKFQMYEYNLYVNIKSTGKPYYFFELSENSIYYACQIVCLYIPNPTEAQTLDYEKPAGATWNFPNVSRTAQLYLFTEEMGTLLGYNQLILPDAPLFDENFEIKSQKAPEISPVQNYVMHCDCFNHQYGLVGFNQIFFQIPIDKSVGLPISFQPSFLMELACTGTRDHIEFWFTDEDGNKLEYRDKAISMILIIDFPETKI
jgi:hypothetical protein